MYTYILYWEKRNIYCFTSSAVNFLSRGVTFCVRTHQQWAFFQLIKIPCGPTLCQCKYTVVVESWRQSVWFGNSYRSFAKFNVPVRVSWIVRNGREKFLPPQFTRRADEKWITLKSPLLIKSIFTTFRKSCGRRTIMKSVWCALHNRFSRS